MVRIILKLISEKEDGRLFGFTWFRIGTSGMPF